MTTTTSEFTVIENSKNVTGGFYKSETNELFVRFKSGAIYKYADVPTEIYLSFLESPSKGAFVNDNLKGKYNFKKVDSIA